MLRVNFHDLVGKVASVVVTRDNRLQCGCPNVVVLPSVYEVVLISRCGKMKITMR